MAGLRRHTRFYPFFSLLLFHFFIIIWRFWITRLAPYLLVFRFHSVYTTKLWRLANWPRGDLYSKRRKKIPERNSLYSPRIADHVLLVWTTGQQWANGKKAPGPPLFLYLVWRTRGLLRPDTNFLQQQRGVAASAYELQYTGPRGRRRTRKRAGLGWIGLASGILGTGEALSYFSWVDHGPPAFWTFFHLF